MRDAVFFLRKIPGKYDKEYIDGLLRQIEEPIKETLSTQGFGPKDQF